MSSHYYIDESGNAGDLARSAPGLAFADQPIFTLAAVGLDDSPAMTEAVDALKAKHRVTLPELKASRLHDRPAFILDVLSLLAEARSPLLAEVVEKRFNIAIHLVNHQLLTGGHHIGDDVGERLARALAEFIGQAAPDAVLETFIAACSAPSAESVTRSLTTLRDWGAAFRPGFELSEIVAGFAQVALDELEPDAEPDDPYGFNRFLPVPDPGPSGKMMWMLPALSCFSNIYGRLNLLHGRRIADITLVHDEQRYVEGALRDGKAVMETLRSEMARFRPAFADYKMAEAATLEFRRSTDEIGLQLADLVAGSLARHMRTVLSDPRAPRPLQPVLDRVLEFTDPARGLGINFVATDRLLAWARIQTF